MREITFFLTSCGRLDLLEQTLDSFFKYNTYPIKRFVITEDSCDAAVYEEIRSKYGDRFDILCNEQKKGQIKTIVDGYKTIDTEFVFHCEDDWEFYRPGFIEDSIKVLDAEPTILQTWHRSEEDINSSRPKFDLYDHRTVDGVGYRRVKVEDGWEWGYFSFNPGLKRMSDYHLIGDYGKYKSEIDINVAYRELGFVNAILDDDAVKHIGLNRAVHDPTRKWPGRRKSNKPKGLKRLWVHIHRLVTEGKW
ncbi:glycosyltransferase [uncultured Thalassospira sp.]|mgnify:FL=1|uniref:glycosyltransferase n=1 Tax=uncultured Thalassospira sp. TaxID=404382 RepID=UPI00258D5C42|nr:glycosyltransferase [uncultured Thalassospira sp.]